MATPNYRFARSPKWIFGHLLALVLLVSFVNLGFWQLRRLDQRRHLNALVEQHEALPVVGVDTVVEPGTEGAALDDLRFRAASATGTYVDGSTTTVRQTQDGVPGGYVLTPMTLADGDVVVVLRGFGGTDPSGQLRAPDPPTGEVEVEGILVPDGRLDRPTRRAVDELGLDAGTTLPVVLQASSSTPADAPDVLVPVPRPALDEGPHLSYAIQWFLFATVGVIGYPILLRRKAREVPELEEEPAGDGAA